MSDPVTYTPSPAFDRVANELDIAVESFWFNTQPAAQAARLEGRIKMAAKLLAKVAQLPHSTALEFTSQALRFQSWHHLSKHMGKAAGFAEREPLPVGWLDELSAAVVLTVEAEDDVALPAPVLDAFESFFSSMKTERIARKVYRTRDEARADVFDYIERLYNPTRRHSTIGYVSPVQYEQAQRA